jgi:ArsR family transcriptional regulator, arsenate/arsenite/antimonite-responsive transcriptional repressor
MLVVGDRFFTRSAQDRHPSILAVLYASGLVRYLDLIQQCETPLVAPVLSDEEAEALARLLKAVAEPMRVKILHRLASAAPDAVCVCDLTAPLGLMQPTVSYHLRILRRAGLVDRRQQRNFAYYSVRPGALEHLAGLIGAERAEAV